MKKITALIMVLAICLSYFTIPASAKTNPDFKVCIDVIQTRTDACPDKEYFLANPGVEDFDKNVAEAGGKYKLTNSKAKYLFIEGWISTDLEYADEDTSIGTRTDGGGITWTSEYDPNLNPGNTYHDYALRTFINMPIYKGTHHVEVLAKIYGEADPVLILEFDYEAGFGDETVITPAPDPTPTPEPTTAPTAEPATEVPATEVPATEDSATAVPATVAPQTTEAPKSDDSGKINPAVIIAIAAAVVVIGVVVFLVTKKKK